MATERQIHWDSAYAARTDEAQSWFEATPEISVELVTRYLHPGQAFIDIGGGASRLVDTLLARGFGPLSVLDISDNALSLSRTRLGANASEVDWIVADITTWRPDRTYTVWHDRAVFHFLTSPEDRAAYVRNLASALAPGGTAIIATFDETGPETCSGLPVARYSPKTLAGELERLQPGRFVPIESRRHAHATPAGRQQDFQYSVLRAAPEPAS